LNLLLKKTICIPSLSLCLNFTGLKHNGVHSKRDL
jgi:hypothetical protein